MRSIQLMVGLLISFSTISVFAQATRSNEDLWIEMGNKKSIYRIQDCPVVGNKNSKIYFVPTQYHYRQMLVVNKCVGRDTCLDNRECFESETQALQAGFRKSESPVKASKDF